MYIAGMWGIISVSAIYILICLFCMSRISFGNNHRFFMIIIFLLYVFGGWRMNEYNVTFMQYKNMSVDDYVSVTGEVVDITNNQYKYLVVIKQNELYHYVYCDNVEDIKIGYKIYVEGTVMKMEVPRNPGNYNEFQYLKSIGVASKIKCECITVIEDTENEIKTYIGRIKDALCERIDEIASVNEAGILKTMLFGEKGDMDKDVNRMYQQAGIAHIVCISGLHISALGTGLFSLLRRKLSYYSSSVISIIFMILFAILTGNGVSAKRALIMFGIALLGKVLGRKYDIKTALMIAVMILLYSNPFYIFNISFRLSVLAIVAIAFVYPIIWRVVDKIWGNKNKIISNILESVVISASVNIVTMPVIAGNFYEISLYSLLINLVVVPFMTLLLWLGLIAVMVSFVWLFAGKFIIGTSIYILKLYEFICKLNEALPCSTISVKEPKTEDVVLYYVALILCLILIKYVTDNNHKINSDRINRCMIGIVGLSFMMMVLIFRKDTETLVTFIDVGQGDCAFINTGGSRILVDGGSSDIRNVGEYRIAPCIKSKGYKYIDVVFISHPDKDHISGIVEIIEKELLEIGKVIIAGVDNLDIETVCKKHNEVDDESINNENTDNEYMEYVKLLSILDENSISYSFVSKGDVINTDGISIKVLHPYKGYNGSLNQESLVVHIECKTISLLFTGDIGEEEEVLVCDMIKEMNLRVDVLKVAHHGSKYSTSGEFLNKVKPKYSVISCGQGNSYGHPHSEVLERLESIGSRIWVTSECGAVSIKNDKGITVYSQINYK